MLPAELSQLKEVQTRLPHGRQQCALIMVMLPAELGQLEALERRALERQQLAKVRLKEQHQVARKRQERAAPEAVSSLLLFSACRQHNTSHIRSRPPPLRAVSSSGLAASSDLTIAQKYQQLEKEMARKLKAFAARRAGGEAARSPHPRRVGGDLRTPARLANLAGVVRRSADEDEGAPTCLIQPACPSVVGCGTADLLPVLRGSLWCWRVLRNSSLTICSLPALHRQEWLSLLLSDGPQLSTPAVQFVSGACLQ